MTDLKGAMPYVDFLARIVDDGIAECREAYPGDAGRHKREGAIRGFEECRGKSVAEIRSLLVDANREVVLKMREQATDYWHWRSRELQVEWVLNVLSAAEYAAGRTPHVMPTARAMSKATEILRMAA